MLHEDTCSSLTKARGQGATEYLLIIATVIAVAAAGIFFLTSAGPSAMITGVAKTKSSDNTVVIFTPSTSMTPKTISADDWSWKVYRDATLVGSGGGSDVGDLKRGEPVELNCSDNVVRSGDEVKITYGGTTYDAATVT